MSQYIAANQASQKAFFKQLKKYYGFYTGGFLAFLLLLAGTAATRLLGRSSLLDANTFTIASVVLLASVVQSAIEMSEKRYGVPLQPLTALVVLTLVMKTMERIRRPSTSRASGDACHA